MESTTSHQLKVGIFLAGALIITLVSIFFLGGDSFFKEKAVLHAHFDQVQGLAPGSTVTLSGIPIGNVDEIKFLPNENKLDVVMEIDAEFLPRITGDSVVEIKTQGALGDKYIYIISGDNVQSSSALGEACPSALIKFTTGRKALTLSSHQKTV